MVGLSIEAGIKQVYNGACHVVILGAGASIASTFRNSEANGKTLPSMDNFSDVVGLNDIINKIPQNLRFRNFEKLYSSVHNNNPESEIILEIESRINKYFGNMKLSEEPTLYDYLMLSLRKKDLIATFNWDPFLFQAYNRISKFTKNLPQIVFLHGSVAIGYNKDDDLIGPAGCYIRSDGGFLKPTKLLYPIEHKDYTSDDFISSQWKTLKDWLESSSTVRVTIFGYGAPVSDIEAVELLNSAWGTPDDRDMEQFEIIDVATEKQLRQRWDGFIHSHHYDITSNYFGSSLAANPRRSCESYCSHYQPFTPDEAFRKNNPIPENFRTLAELWEWHLPLIKAEQEKFPV